jgi:hypothetical protein
MSDSWNYRMTRVRIISKRKCIILTGVYVRVCMRRKERATSLLEK